MVESPRGSVTGTALLWEGIREDTIFVPNTFGPAQKIATEFGLPLYDAANLLTDDRFFDSLSGQQAYKCFACRVRKGWFINETVGTLAAFMYRENAKLHSSELHAISDSWTGPSEPGIQPG